MIVRLHGRLALVLTPLFTLPLVFAIGCSGGASDDNAESANSAIGTNPVYDGVIAHGTKIVTQDTPTATVSASTHLIGWIPSVAPSAVTKQLLTVGRWADIRDTDGSQPFTQAQVLSDVGTIVQATAATPAVVADAGTVDASADADGGGDGGHVEGGAPAPVPHPAAPAVAAGIRKLSVQLTLDGGVQLDIKATASEADNAFSVNFTNTSAYTHWLVGMILEPQKLVMDLKLIPYNGGTIVDATTRVKLDQMEDKAPKLTASITAIFDWLKKNSH